MTKENTSILSRWCVVVSEVSVTDEAVRCTATFPFMGTVTGVEREEVIDRGNLVYREICYDYPFPGK